jgi:hypothetical protein
MKWEIWALGYGRRGVPRLLGLWSCGERELSEADPELPDKGLS